MTDANGTPQPYPKSEPAYAPSPSADNPGKTLGIVALVLSIPFNIVGAILGIIALVQSRRAGFKNGPALAAIIVGFVLFIVAIIVIIVIVSFGVTVGNDIIEQCASNPNGTIVIQGEEFPCSDVS